MKKNNYFRSERWDAGIQNKLQAALASEFDTPQEVEAGQASGALQAVLTPVADLALTYYDKRIRGRGLRRLHQVKAQPTLPSGQNRLQKIPENYSYL